MAITGEIPQGAAAVGTRGIFPSCIVVAAFVKQLTGLVGSRVGSEKRSYMSVWC